MSTLSLTSALHEGGWSKPLPGRFTTGNDLVFIAREEEWTQVSVWTGAENQAYIGIRSPYHPTRNVVAVPTELPRCA